MELVTAQEQSRTQGLLVCFQVWSMGRQKGEVGRNLGGAELVGLGVGGSEGGADRD